jgi:hypothetical protein
LNSDSFVENFAGSGLWRRIAGFFGALFGAFFGVTVAETDMA